MKTRPFGFEMLAGECQTDPYDSHIERRLSSLSGQFANQSAYEDMLRNGDPVVYEVRAMERPEQEGELSFGLSIVHPGRVGDEYYMTKGHFHSVRDTAEVYHCLRGRGAMLMENGDGDWAFEEFRPGRVVYVMPGWAHRSINLSEQEDLVTFFVYPSHAGHDYATIESRGFRKLILREAGGYRLADNPRWSQAGAECHV